MDTLVIRPAVADLQQQGVNSLLLWVLADNPARHFYEGLGGQYVREKEIDIGQQRLFEVAYGWPDLSADYADFADFLWANLRQSALICDL